MQNKIFQKTLMVTVIITTMVTTLGSTVHASDESELQAQLSSQISSDEDTYGGTVLTYDEFDADYYAEANPDVAAAVGTDKNSLYKHYVTNGYGEDRKTRMLRASVANIDNFDADAYATAYQDLAAVYGGDAEALLEEYQTTGIEEGRQGYFTTDIATAEDKVFDIINEIITDDMSNQDKVKAIHDWLCINVAYDYDNYINNTIPDSSYEITGPILYGTAVCQGYAEAFDFFMKAVGIKSEIVVGEATNSTGYTGSHAWNKVYLDGMWYYLDVTWDDPVGNVNPGGIVCRYTYYLTTDGTFSGTHTEE